VIELLEEALCSLCLIGGSDNKEFELARKGERLVDEAVELLRGSRYETPEQRKERTGEEWPDNWPVYTRLRGKTRVWDVGFYGAHKKAEAFVRYVGGNDAPVDVICATMAGPPPDDYVVEDCNG
jgi:hypothetical protein